MKLEALFEQTHRLPSVPRVVQQLIDSFNQPDADLTGIAAQIAQDQVIAAKTLRLANCAHTGATRRIGSIKDRDEVVGNSTKVKVVKNKVAPPFRQVEFDIMYGEGISKTGELIDLGVKAGVVEKSGSWYSYGDERIGQGRENAKQYLRDNPDVAYAIEDKIRASHGLDFGASPEDDALTED